MPHPYSPFSLTGERALDLAVDCAAVARLTRLVTTDTFPPARWARAKILARWPAPGDALTHEQATIGWANAMTPDGEQYQDARGHPSPTPTYWTAVLPSGERGGVVHDDEGRPVWEKGTPLGELITCPWCASIWIAGGVVLARRLAPGVWDPIARLLAASMAAGLAAEATS